jgi:two-component system chemotaxis sensor kinase CheA
VRTRTLRVDADTLDRILDLTAEIAVARGRIAEMLDEGPALEAYRDAERLHADLQQLVMELRMVPLGSTFTGYHRSVRDTAAANGKQARFRVIGEDVQVDTRVAEAMRDPLTHLVRNAVAHGIEDAGGRAARGKDPCGTITLRASRQSGSILIELSDDGAGLAHDGVLRAARRLGLLAEGTTALSALDVNRLIFEPGFSTSERVTDLAGRGVGLDVVRRNVEALRGSVTVTSEEGKGTTFTIRLPLTLAIIQGFAVKAAGETFVLPLETVLECLDLPKAHLKAGELSGVLNLRGQALPYLRLREALSLSGPTSGREQVIVLQNGSGKCALAVDGVIGGSQAVIKPLGRLLKGLRGVSGCTVLGNGRVALILDIPALFRNAVEREDRSSGLVRNDNGYAGESAAQPGDADSLGGVTC